MMDDYTDPAAAPEQDAGASEADAFSAELRKIREENGIEVPQGMQTAPPVGVSPLAQELDQSGWFGQQEAAHAAQIEQERQEAIARSQAGAPPPAPKGRQSGTPQPPVAPPSSSDQQSGISRWLQTDPTPALTGGAPYTGIGQDENGLYEAGRWGVNAAGQIPGGAVAMGGSVLQAPDVVVSSTERLAQEERQWQLAAMLAIDSGQPLPPRPSRLPATGPDVRLAQYINAAPEERGRLATALRDEIAAFNPTPIQDRPLYQAGAYLTDLGRNLVPQLEGFDENSWSTQVGRGLGSMITGLGVSGFIGRTAGGLFFAGAGMGEATERAVQFDRAERAQGRAGLTQEQIIAAGLLGVAPGTTDIVPIENMLGRLRIPGLTPETAGIVARVIGRTGGRVLGQALLEGGQEGLQQFLQNLIAREVYNPNQALGEGVPGSAGVGGIVGGTAEGARSAASSVMGLGGRRGGRSGTPSATPAPEAAPPSAPTPAPDAGAPVEAVPFGFDPRHLPPVAPQAEAPTAAPEAATAAPQAEAPTAAPEAGTAPAATEAAPEAAPAATPAERETLTRLPRFEDLSARLPTDADGNPDMAALQQRMQQQYGVDSWGELNVVQRVELFRQLGVEARGREAAAAQAPAALPQTPAGPEGQLQEALERILQESPAEVADAQQMAERFASPEAVAAARAVDQNLPQWRQQFEADLVQRGIPQEDAARLVNESVRIIGAEFQRAGGPATLEAIRQYVYEEGQKAAIEAIDTREPGAVAGQGQPAAAPSAGPTPAAGSRAAGTSPAAGASAAGTGAAARAEPTAASPTPATPAQPAGAQRTGTAPSGPSAGRAEPAAAPAAQRTGADERGVRDGERAAGGAAAVEPASVSRRYDGPELTDAEIDAIVDSWKYVREFDARPKPVSIVNFIVRGGGIEDRGGNLRSMVGGSVRNRPGLIRRAPDGTGQLAGLDDASFGGSGLTLDDWALRLWEVGYFPEHTERPTINELLDKVSDDLFTGTEYAASDATYLEDANVVAEMVEGLNDYGIVISAFRKEETLRAYLGQSRAATPVPVEGDHGAQAAVVRGQPAPAAETRQGVGQTSFLPEATTQEEIAAEAKRREQRGGREAMDEGLFGSGRDQIDLVDLVREAERSAPTEPTPAQHSQFRGILASRQPLNWKTIQAQLGATPEQMEALKQEAAQEGLLRLDRNGTYRRTPQAHAAPAAVIAPTGGTQAVALGRIGIPTQAEIDEQLARMMANGPATPKAPDAATVAVVKRQLEDIAGQVRVYKSNLDDMQSQVDMLPAMRERLAWLRSGAVGSEPAAGGPAWASVRDFLDNITGVREGLIQERIRRLEDAIERAEGYWLRTIPDRQRILDILLAGAQDAMQRAGLVSSAARPDSLGRVPQITAAPAITVSSEERVEGTIRAREAQTGNPVSGAVRAYATELLSRLGTPMHAATLERAKADKSLKVADARDLAAVAGYPVATKATKATAFASIEKRNADQRAFLEKQATEAVIGVQLAALASGRRVQAAIKIGDEVFTAPNHMLAMEKAAEKLGQAVVDKAVGDLSASSPFADGFVDDAGNFMTRAETAAYLGLVEPGEDVFLSSEQTRGEMDFRGKRITQSALEARQKAPPYTEAFASRVPEVVASIEGWVRKMLPPEIAVRVVDRIDMGGYGVYARYTFLESPTRLMDRAVEIALSTQLGVTPLRTTIVKSFHEVTHALREYGRPAGGIYGTLLTDKEWQIVVERAKKIGVEKNITALQDGRPIPAIPVYRSFYREQLRAAGFRGEALDQRVEELIDQELVANLAEQWATGTSFGAKIDSWFERIVKFIDAVRNALRGLGFQTYDDVFRSMASGEVARRPEGGRREPTLEIPKYDPATFFPDTPSPADIHVASEEGQEALGLFPAIRAFHSASPETTLVGRILGSLLQRENIDDRMAADAAAVMDAIGLPREAFYMGGRLQTEAVRRWFADWAGRFSPDADLIQMNYAGMRGFQMDRAASSNLAHEWWHYLSHYFAEMAGMIGAPQSRMLEYLPDRGHQAAPAMRAEVKAALNRLLASVFPSEFAKSGAASKKGASYLTDRAEVLARAFQSWVSHKTGGQIDPNSRKAWFKFSSPEEQARVFAAFDNLFDTVKLRESTLPGGSGVELYALATTPESRPFSITGFDGTVTEKVKEGGERLRTYAVGDSSLIVSEQPDGGWELTFFKAEDASKVPAIVAAIEANDLGKPISPRGWLTPQGYQYWQQVAPDRVRYHVNAGEMFGGMFASPRAVEFAEAVLAEAGARQVTASIPEVALAPISRADYVDEIAYREAIRRQYFEDGSKGVSSRLAPYAGELPPVGSWRISPIKGLYGNDIEHLVRVGINQLDLPELVDGQLDPLKRGDDERYAQWLAEGKRPPPIEIVQTDGGTLRVMDGHRRVLAARRAGAEEIEAWVSYTVPAPHGKVGSNGKPIMTGLTFEIAEAANASKPADQARLTEASAHLSRLKSSIPQEAFSSARLQEMMEFKKGTDLASFSSQPLDMSPEARKARAEAMGFDTSKVFYHGTANEFDAFDLTRDDGFHSVPAVWFADSERTASIHANDVMDMRGGTGARVVAAYLRTSRQKVVTAEDVPAAAGDNGTIAFDSAEFDRILETAQNEGYESVRIRNVDTGADASAGYEPVFDLIAVFDPANIRSVNAQFDPSQEGSPVLLASFQGQGQPPPGGPPNRPMLPVTPASQGEVRGLADIIADLKSALNLTTTQGLYGMRVRDRAGNRTWGFRPQRSVRGQYDANAGVARIRIATDIDAIAEQGGSHVEQVFGAPMQAFLQQHAEDLAVPAAPDAPLPRIAPTGFSGVELDADTQRTLIEAADATRAWQAAQTYDNAARAAIASNTLVRRLGRTVAQALLADVTGTQPLASTAAPVDPAGLAAYVQARYSATGTPTPRVAPTIPPAQVSQAFASFFRRYITDPDGAKRDMPGVYVGFEEFLDANDPFMLEGIEKVQLEVLSQDYKAYREATVVARMRADLHTDADHRFTTFLKQMTDVVGQVDTWKGLANFLYSAGVDRNDGQTRAIQRALEQADQNDVRGRDGRAMSLAVHENPVKILRSMPDVFKAGLRWLQDGMPQYRHADAGWEVHGPSGVVGFRPTLAGAQELAATAPNLRIVEVPGRRSRSIKEALTLAGVWNNMTAYKNFGTYLISRRAVEEWRRWEAQGSRPQADGKGLQSPPHRESRVDHEQNIADLEAANPNFRQAAEAVYDFLWQAAVHDHAAGRLSDEELNYRASRRSFYVPFARDMRDRYDLGVRGTRATLRRFVRDKVFRGSSRDIIHPIETIFDQTFHRAAATRFNEYVKAWVSLGESIGQGGGEIAERVTRTELVEANNEAFRQLELDIQAMGYQPDDAREIVKRIESDFGDTQILLQSTAASVGRPLLLPLWENGQRVMVRFNDPQLAQDIFQGIQGVGQELSSILVDFMAAPSRWLRLGVTTSTSFLGINPVRDALAAWIITGAVPGYAQVKGLSHELRQTDAARMYSEVGGIFGGANVQSLSKVKDKTDVMALQHGGLAINKKGLAIGAGVGGGLGFMLGGPGGALLGTFGGMFFHRGIRQLGTTLSHFADVSETATRFGVYDKAYKAALAYNPNLTPYEAAQDAAFVARDLIDYSRQGSKMFQANRVVTFMNAAIQGIDRAVRGLLGKSDRGSSISVTKLTAIMAAAGATGIVAGPVIGTSLALAAPVVAGNLAARSAAARALLGPFFKKQMAGMPISQEEERAQVESAKMWLRLMAVTLGTVAIGLVYLDDDRYRRLRSQLRNRYQLIFPFSDSPTSEWFQLPKVWELSLPSTILEAAIDAQFRNDPRFFARVREGVWETLVPPGVPQYMTLWGDIRHSYDSYRGRPLVSPHRRHLDPQMQFDAYSSQFAIALSRFVNSHSGLQGPVEWTGSVLFATRFQLTPAIIDHALRTGFGHWGADIQRGSDALGLGASRVRDYPLIGGLLQRFIGDPNRSSDAMAAMQELARHNHGYVTAARGYTARLTELGAVEANAWLATLSPELRAYALNQETTRPGIRRQHPWNRLQSLVDVTYGIEREILQRRFGTTVDPNNPEPIELTAEQAVQLRQVMALIRHVEGHNALVVLGHGQFANRELLSIDPAIVLLDAISTTVSEEYRRRLGRAHVSPDFAMIASEWPERRDELLRRWQEAVDEDAAARLSSGRRPRNTKLPIGASPLAPVE